MMARLFGPCPLWHRTSERIRRHENQRVIYECALCGRDASEALKDLARWTCAQKAFDFMTSPLLDGERHAQVEAHLARIREVYPSERIPCAWCGGHRLNPLNHNFDCPVPDVHFLLDELALALRRQQGLQEALIGLVDAVTTEVNEKGGGGFVLARLSDARDALRPLPREQDPT